MTSLKLGATEVSVKLARSILTKPTGSLKSFDFTLNPYTGCQFGCSYCYAAFFTPDDDKFAAWGTWVEAKANAVELLRSVKGLPGSRIYIGSATDPYQPAERNYELTRSLLEYMAEVQPQPSVVIQTRSPIAARDIDVFQRFAELRVNMSITTDCDETRKRFEPKCASISQRMEAIKAIKQAGIGTGISLCPLLPISDIEGFAKCITELNPDHCYIGYFHETTGRYAAGTLDRAWSLAKEMGWDKAAFQRTAEELSRHLPKLKM